MYDLSGIEAFIHKQYEELQFVKLMRHRWKNGLTKCDDS